MSKNKKQPENDLRELFLTHRPGEWEKLPDFDLYMDQVISYIQRQHIGFVNDEALTSAMVNNYIKKGLLPRAKGKRYEREHIAYLTMICLFKQILSVDDTESLIKQELEKHDIKSFYEEYRGLLDEECSAMAKRLTKTVSREDRQEALLQLVVSAYVRKLACEELLRELQSEEDE